MSLAPDRILLPPHNLLLFQDEDYTTQSKDIVLLKYGSLKLADIDTGPKKMAQLLSLTNSQIDDMLRNRWVGFSNITPPDA